jgi:hypothetical protein
MQEFDWRREQREPSGHMPSGSFSSKERRKEN